jgi:poly(3-hydroxyalkanoate) synthetase
MSNGSDKGPFPFGVLWPALAAASVSEMSLLWARQLIDMAVGADSEPTVPQPSWTMPNRTALELSSVVLRDFSTGGEGTPTLLCAPFVLHDATMVDFAPDHSAVAALREAGLQRLAVTHWRSATREMQFLTIDSYLSDLNVLVDHLGGSVNLIGICQGGWLGLAYAARFPGKVRKLALVGAPVDLDAAESTVSRVARNTPPAIFRELVELGQGRIPGHRVLQFWKAQPDDPDTIYSILEPSCERRSGAFKALEQRFRDWYAWTVDLPGAYYLEAAERIYRGNELARGEFTALGKRVDLAKVDIPLLMLAAEGDDIVAPEQLFAAARLVGTPAEKIATITAKGDHYSLFMNARVLRECWPAIARWMWERNDAGAGRNRPASAA